MWFKRLVGSRRRRLPLEIRCPTVGFLNLLDGVGASLLLADQRLLSARFRTVTLEDIDSNECDILFLYCSFDENGYVKKSGLKLNAISSKTRSRVVIVATPNPPEIFSSVLAEGGSDWNANTVLTIDRREYRFGVFLGKLFELMCAGKSMLTAWVELAPQNASEQHFDAPSVILTARAGDIMLVCDLNL